MHSLFFRKIIILETLLKNIIDQLPREEIEKYYRQRQRPRRTGKRL